MQLVRILLLLLLVFPVTVHAQKKRISVLIDAGHGGSDPGHLSADNAHLQEKELNLIIAKKVGNYLTNNLQNVDVTYTRTSDEFVSLDARVEKANNADVDYFISIHCNASEKSKTHGTECHVHTFDSKSSVALAKSIEKEFSGKAGRSSRGVKDNGDREHTLQVLKFTKMTSVLVECGFLTNTKEANYLNTTEGQDIIASALFRGIRGHLKKEFPKISFTKQEEKSKGKGNSATSKSGSYYVQITSSKDWIDTDHESFKRTGEKITREKLNTTSAYKYRYLIGSFASKSDAKSVLEKVKTKGFPDAIIIEK
jgi:N-acetylmuramoyl-L-alanine amidase